MVQLKFLWSVNISQLVLNSASLQKSGQLQINALSTPLLINPVFDENSSSSPLTNTELLYQSLLGDMRYLADIWHLQIYFFVSNLAQHLITPASQHMMLLKHTLRYLRGTRTHCILFKHSNEVSFNSNSILNTHHLSTGGLYPLTSMFPLNPHSSGPLKQTPLLRSARVNLSTLLQVIRYRKYYGYAAYPLILYLNVLNIPSHCMSTIQVQF